MPRTQAATKRRASKARPKTVLKKAKGRAALRIPAYVGVTSAEATFLDELIAAGRAPLIANAYRPVVSIWVQGSFTIARIAIGEAVELVGVSKRNCYDDPNDQARGRRIALARAARGEAVLVTPRKGP